MEQKVRMKIAIITLVLIGALTGCDDIVKQITPDAHKLVEAEANEGVNADATRLGDEHTARLHGDSTPVTAG